MAQYCARIIRALIVSSLGFGGAVGLLTFITVLVLTGSQNAVQLGLFAAIGIGSVFSILLVVVLLLSDLTKRLLASHSRAEEIWELEQVRKIQIEGNTKEVKQFCRHALLKIPNVKAVHENPQELSITASIGPSWRSAGENMEITMESLGENNWQVKCISHSLTQNVVFDYAKNFDNVEDWLKNMHMLMQEAKQSA